MASDAISMQVTVNGASTSTGQYLQGPKVTGNVAMTVRNPVRYHSIELVLICQSTVDTNGRPKNLSTEILRMDEFKAPRVSRLVHLFDKIVLKTCDGDLLEILATGSYNFPFSFTVSKNDLPSTFTIPGHEHNGVAYYIECLVLPEKDAMEAISRQFTYFPFIGTVDVGTDQFLLPVKRQQKWPIGGFLGIGTHPIRLVVELERNGFCVGDTIKVNATVTNSTGKEVSIRASLVRTPFCDIRTPLHRYRRRWDSETVTRQNGGAIGARSTFTEGLDVVIPENCPVTMSMNAEILQLEYELVVRVCSCYRIDTSLRIPITIGSRNSHYDF